MMRSSLTAAARVFFFFAAVPLQAVEVAWNTASDVPIVSNSYEPGGELLQFQLNFAPDAGTQLSVVKHTGPAFMETRFSNLPHGGTVNLTHNGISYPFVANYFGGSGNDLVLVWANNRIFAWGDQRGLNNYSGMPAAIPSPRVIDAKTDGKTVFSMETAPGCSFAILSDGTIAMWGQPYTSTFNRAPFQIGSTFSFPGKTPVALATGLDHGLVLCQDGTLLAWGENASGQLGIGTQQRPTGPVAVSTTPGLSALSGKNVTAVAAGQGFSVALCSDGTLCTWGARVTGHPTIRSSLYPMVVDTASPSSAFYQKTITGFAAGFLFVQALCSDGTIIGWGQNDSGQLGTGDRGDGRVPRVIHQGTGVSALHGRVAVELACGGDHGLARCADGALVSWGYDASGQRGTNRLGDRTVPTLVLSDSTDPPSALKGKTIQRITAGTSTSLALCTDGTLASWGQNTAGGVPGNFDYPGPVDTQVIKLCSGARVVDLQQSGLGANHLLIVAYPPDTAPPAAGDFTLATRSTLLLAGNQGVPPGWQDASPPFRYSFSINGVPVVNEWCGLADRIPFFPALADGTHTVRLEV
jgi:alpha-tubulin suppressor-like RCC1 family protein